MTPRPRLVPPALDWQGRHLYLVWPATGRKQYAGSIVREAFPRRWSVWVRGEYLGTYADEGGARLGLEEHARGDRTEKESKV